MIENSSFCMHIKEEWNIIKENYNKGAFGKIIRAVKKNGIINGYAVGDKNVAIKKIKINERNFETEILNKIQIENDKKEKRMKTILKYYGYGIDEEYIYIYLEFSKADQSVI
ncbi:hypothetical protein DICPUDRAFT_78436 [Dictyostelium purpureum]|uniref:Protein kinase domain-containing protein n=1 Tax=Dictyostelium purpureum TaxID=5786 RepID=F0ZJJ5_DICPU|nr:uncharacterized protein DICPUDRAFT_78436 [Dictyostelium purpureum]EGC35856.1 hypothetical protein DICPUDRAFT_78436 [Dictyostelium purpureum]|eukprot:XP_003287587.1 hypothetical protein DICPUDRAFT_78436 [Dictyostelium purpureum]